MNTRSFNYEGFETVAAPVQVMEAFDAPKHVAIPAPAPRPMFSTDEIDLAKTLAKEEGLREGLELAKKQYEEEKNSAASLAALADQQVVVAINNKLVELQSEGLNNRGKFSERLGQLALAIAQKVCGDISGEIIEKQIMTIINESVARIGLEDKIRIHLNAKNAETLNDKFTNAEVSVDDKMQLGDFRLEWQNGFAERDVKKLWESIAEICSRHSSLEENEEKSFAGAHDDVSEKVQSDIIPNASEGSDSNNITKGE